MRRLSFVFAVLACAGCTQTVHFRGPATYVVSLPDGSSRTGALDQGGTVCMNSLPRRFVLRLAPGCVLYGWRHPSGHSASLADGQRCRLPLGGGEGERELVVHSGTVVTGDSAVDVTLGANPADAPSSFLAYHLEAGPLRVYDDSCSALLAAAPSL